MHRRNENRLAYIVGNMSVPVVAMNDRAPVDLLPMAITPGELLAKVLKERGITQADFGRKVRGDYQKVHRWTKGTGFGVENQKLAAEALGLRDDFFAEVDDDDAAARAREAARREVFAKFLATDMGQELKPEDQAALNATPVPRNKQPTVAFYQGAWLNYRNLLPLDRLDESVKENEQLDAEVENKRTPPRKR